MSFTRTLSNLAASALVAGALAATVPAAHAAGEGSIRGTVLETGHEIAPGIDVSLYRTSGEFVTATVTDGASGSYNFTGLEAGSYTLWFENQNEAVNEWYDNKTDKPQATPIVLAEGQNFLANAYLTQVSENLVRPSLSGTAAVGSTLTATQGTWFPTLGVAFSYQWLRDGTPIDGATVSTYTLRQVDASHSISVRSIAQVQGMTETATSVSTPAVTGGSTPVLPVTNGVKPTITGNLTVGSQLHATPGTWSPADASVTVQWLRGNQVVATGLSYTTSAADVGATLLARATASKVGWTTTSAESTPFGPVTSEPSVVLAPVNTALPTVSGTARVGQTLSATTGTWNTAVDVTHRWTRNGKAISAATGRSYRLTAADAGARIGFEVTARNDAGSATVNSGGRLIAKATSRLSATVKAPARGRLSVKATVTSLGARTGRVTVVVRIGTKTTRKQAVLQRGGRTITFKGLRRGKATIRLTYAGDSSTSTATVTKRIRVR